MTTKEKYNFFLNPYTDAAFTKCPKCDGKTKVKKFPLLIFIEKIKFVDPFIQACFDRKSCTIAMKDRLIKPCFDKEINGGFDLSVSVFL